MYKIMLRATVLTVATIVFPTIFAISVVKQPPVPFNRDNWGNFKMVFTGNLDWFADKYREIGDRLHDYGDDLDYH